MAKAKNTKVVKIQDEAVEPAVKKPIIIKDNKSYMKQFAADTAKREKQVMEAKLQAEANKTVHVSKENK